MSSLEAGNPTRWWVALLVTALLGLYGFVLRHEGTIGNLEGQLSAIQAAMGRVENKVDDLRGKK